VNSPENNDEALLEPIEPLQIKRGPRGPEPELAARLKIRAMAAHYETFKNLAAGVSSIATTLALAVGGWWTYQRFIRSRESTTRIDLDVDLAFVHRQHDNWIVEGVALLKNPGSVRLDVKAFTYDLHYAFSSDKFERPADEDDAMKENPSLADALHVGVKGSWLEGWDYLYLEPGERARFSFLASLPSNVTMVSLHCEFTDKADDMETVTKTYSVPIATSKP